MGHQMSHYVRVLLDEVFGPENFLNEIARVKCNPKNFSRRAFGNIKDCLLYYSKNGDHVWNEQRELMSEEDLVRLFPRVDSQGRRYATTPLHAPGETRNGPTGQRWKGLAPPQGRHWRYDPQELSRLDETGLIEWSTTGNPRKIIFAEQVRCGGKKRQDVWIFKDPAYPSYPTEKNFDLLRQIVLTSSDPGDLVLDCFAGSGTTLAAAASLNRRWIGIDSSAMAIKRATERLRAMAVTMPFRVDEIKATSKV
jgi:adenine-specific DNA-methyltransferase